MTLNSTGSVRPVTRIVFFRSGLQIVLTVPLVLVIGFNGVPVAYLFSAVVMAPWLVRLLRPGVGRHLVLQLRWICAPFAAAVAAGVPLLFVPLPTGLRAAARHCGRNARLHRGRVGFKAALVERTPKSGPSSPTLQSES